MFKKYQVKLIDYVTQNYFEISKLILAGLISCCIFFYWNSYFVNTDIYTYFNKIYSMFTYKIMISIAKTIGIEHIIYNIDTNIVSGFGKEIELKLPFRSYYIFLSAFVILFTIPFKKWIHCINLIIFSLLFIAFRSSCKTIIELYFIQTTHRVLLLWFESSINIVVLAIVYVFFKYNLLFEKVFSRLMYRFRQLLVIDLSYVLFLIITLTSLPRILLMYFAKDFLDSIVNITISLSQYILHLVNKNAYVINNTLFLDHNWIRLEYACLGIGVFTMALIIIFALKSEIINKIIFSIIFGIVFFISNSIRLSLLLLYINHIHHTQKLAVSQLHGDVTVFMYIVAFISICVYIMYFSDVKISFRNPNKKNNNV